MAQVYPKHIYDPVRIKIANIYLKREVRKYLPSVRGKNIWKKIDADIDKWFDKSPNVAAVRDFWNGFWGVAMGFKLKNGLIQAITAENIKWELEKNFPLDDSIHTGTLPYISDQLANIKPSAKFLRDFFRKNKALAEKWLKEFESHAKTSEERDIFPIIALENPNGEKKPAMVIDGNRRVVLSVLQRKMTINAYVGTYTEGKMPINFWLPTPFLMELVREAELINDYEGALQTLQKLIRLSKSGEYELRDRVLIGSNEFRQKLRTGLDY